eukprot:scaffold2297_cov102-Isochrysis_galbana.AAC.10
MPAGEGAQIPEGRAPPRRPGGWRRRLQLQRLGCAASPRRASPRAPPSSRAKPPALRSSRLAPARRWRGRRSNEPQSPCAPAPPLPLPTPAPAHSCAGRRPPHRARSSHPPAPRAAPQVSPGVTGPAGTGPRLSPPLVLAPAPPRAKSLSIRILADRSSSFGMTIVGTRALASRLQWLESGLWLAGKTAAPLASGPLHRVPHNPQVCSGFVANTKQKPRQPSPPPSGICCSDPHLKGARSVVGDATAARGRHDGRRERGGARCGPDPAAPPGGPLGWRTGDSSQSCRRTSGAGLFPPPLPAPGKTAWLLRPGPPPRGQVVLGADRSFTFDHVLDAASAQNEVYDECVQTLVRANSHRRARLRSQRRRTHTVRG